MKLLEQIDNYLYDREYKIVIKKNQVYIMNYDEILNFSPTNVSLNYNRKIINIDGTNLVISKMIENEILITGNIINIRIN